MGFPLITSNIVIMASEEAQRLPIPPPTATPHLRTLTLSTLPISSLSSIPPCETLYDSTPDPQAPGSPIILEHSPPTRKSLDTLRSLRERDRTSIVNAPPSRRPSVHSNMSYSTVSAWRWFQGDNKENVDHLLDDDDRAPTVEEERGKIQKKYLSPNNPIVFCHGLLGFDSLTIGPSIAPLEVTHWRGIKEVLEANGTKVLTTRVPATSSPVDRAKVLEQKIEEAYPGKAVHLIGHSMGGLDCRYLTSQLHDHTFSVLSLTTIATPHRGSSFADHFLETVGRARIPSVLALLDMLPNGGGDGKAFESLTRDSMRRFNEETPDVPGVKYYSWGAVYEPGLIDTWKWPHSVILEKEGPNDGLVSVESSKWGTYLGTLEDVNHLDLVGWINTARYKWAEFRGREIKFRPATFYLGVADLLAREVEGLGPALGSEASSGAGAGRRRARSIADDPWDASSDREEEEGGGR
ncbi:hypothetical protein EW146_g302 [Bondarzewia mesenterica]|uniref:AB hydrolase-1 domain-containing protein n=1 Tax=Bondarzewia mesenterica TaxID=1095465 RepID=A0A4S4M9B1_9AGAM|nr:hypothetical protein EW146_g302 [Bondarzewia mesenterica]